MQIQEALQLVQNKFVAESQDQSDGEAVDKYHDAYEKYPCVMEIATYVFADQLVQRNYEAQKQAKEQGQGGAPPEAGNAAPQG